MNGHCVVEVLESRFFQLKFGGHLAGGDDSLDYVKLFFRLEIGHLDLGFKL